MDPNSPTRDELISSKEILRRSGISRATLNNYIKAGILPKPVVRRPQEPSTSTKKIGFFPQSSLDRIERVQRMKREGRSMEAITSLLAQEGDTGPPKETAVVTGPGSLEVSGEGARSHLFRTGRLRLSVDEISFPSYMLNYDFELVWINREGEQRLFKGSLRHEDLAAPRSIFRLLFNWEFHSHVANWRSLLMLHMAYAKVVKLSKTWIAGSYSGISQKEMALLEEIYDQVTAVGNQTVKETYVSLLTGDGLSESFKMTSLLFREGVLFIYVPLESR
ncbi:MAG: MerR family transcriptional regulator [Thermodesulfobacteriota bacterium]